MAEDRFRVLMRWRYTAAYWQAFQAEREKLSAEASRIVEKWRAAGVTFVGGWASAGHVDGFENYAIWEVGDLDTWWQMSDDMSQSGFRKYEDIEFHIGVVPEWEAEAKR
jgi:hypothetical protein